MPRRSASSPSSTRYSGSMPGREGVGAQDARAEAVDRRDPRAPRRRAPPLGRPERHEARRARASFSCAAAFSVKVIARIASTATPSSSTARTKRSTSTDVLPVPAPALSSIEPSRRSIARCCSAVNRRHRLTPPPADRRVRAPAAVGAGVGAGARSARRACSPPCRDRAACPGDPLLRTRPRARTVVVARSRCPARRATLLARPGPAGAGRSCPRAARTRRLPAVRPSSSLHDQHVQRGLEAPLALPVRRLVGVDPSALVVAHEGPAAVHVHAVDHAPHPRAALDLHRRVARSRRSRSAAPGARARTGRRARLVAQVAQQVELEPPHGRPHAGLVGRQAKLAALGAPQRRRPRSARPPARLAGVTRRDPVFSRSRRKVSSSTRWA